MAAEFILNAPEFATENVLSQGNFRIFAVPVKVKGLGAFPVRAFAIV